VQLLKLLQQEDALDGVGYGDEDIDVLLQQLRDQEEVDRQVADEGPEEPPAVAIARTGDLWCLGDHLLLCGRTDRGPDRTTNGPGAAACRSGGRPATPLPRSRAIRTIGGFSRGRSRCAAALVQGLEPESEHR